MKAWREYVAMWRAAFDDSDPVLMGHARFGLVLLHVILLGVVAIVVIALHL